MRLLITVKILVLGENGKEAIDRDREKSVMFSKLLETFRENRKTIITFYQSFQSVYIQHESWVNFPKTTRERSEDFSQALNSLITGWNVYTKNISPSVLCIDLPAVGLYFKTLGFIFFSIDSPASK